MSIKHFTETPIVLIIAIITIKLLSRNISYSWTFILHTQISGDEHKAVERVDATLYRGGSCWTPPNPGRRVEMASVYRMVRVPWYRARGATCCHVGVCVLWGWEDLGVQLPPAPECNQTRLALCLTWPSLESRVLGPLNTVDFSLGNSPLSHIMSDCCSCSVPTLISLHLWCWKVFNRLPVQKLRGYSHQVEDHYYPCNPIPEMEDEGFRQGFTPESTMMDDVYSVFVDISKIWVMAWGITSIIMSNIIFGPWCLMHNYM